MTSSTQARTRSRRPRRIIIGTVIVLVVALLVAFLGLGYVVNDRMTHLTDAEETRANVPDSGHAVQQLTVESSTGRGDIPVLQIAPPEPTDKAAILIHGLGASKEATMPVAEMFLDMGYTVLAYDQVNSGERDWGRNTFGVNESEDALDVLAYAEEQGATEIALWGTSYGGATSAYTAAQAGDRFDHVVLDSPMSDARDMICKALDNVQDETGIPAQLMESAAAPFFRLTTGVSFRDLDAAGALAGTSLPVLIIHSRDDDIVPPYQAEEYKEAVGEPATLIWTHGPHSQAYVDQPDEYQGWLEEFLN